MINLELDGEQLDRVKVDCLDYQVDLIREIPGFRSTRGKITLPRSWATWVTAQQVLKDQLQTGYLFNNWIEKEHQARVLPSNGIRDVLEIAHDDSFEEGLRPYQRAGAAWLALNERALLGDDLGSGKTIQTISAFRRLHYYQHDVFPLLIVCPDSVKHQWKEEFSAWWPDILAVVVQGNATQRRKALEEPFDVCIINWEAMMRHSKLESFGGTALKKCSNHRGGRSKVKEANCEVCPKELNDILFRSVVVDEAHNMKNPQAKKTRATWAVMHDDNVRYRIGLTGTPIANSPEDLWSIMYGICPEEYPTKSSYVTRFCQQAFNFKSGFYETKGLKPDTQEEFYEIFNPRFRRMNKARILSSLPPIVFSTRSVDMSPKQRKAYKELEKEYVTFDDEGNPIWVTNDLTLQLRLLQFASATGYIDDEGNVQLGTPSPKIDELVNILEESEGQVAVASESRKIMELTSKRLYDEGISHELLVGGMTSDQKSVVLNNFQSGDVRVLLFTMKAGGTGTNMTAANTLVYLERSWSMLLNYQTLGRVHRIGSEKHDSINVIDIIAPDTVEMNQLDAIRNKYSLLEQVNRDNLNGGNTMMNREYEESILDGDLL